MVSCGDLALSGSQRRRAALLIGISVRDVLNHQRGRVWIVASLKPTFLWRRIYRDEKTESLSRVSRVGAQNKNNATRDNLRHNNCQTTALIASRATPPHRQNQPDVALLTSDCKSETGNYNGQGWNCQAQAREGVRGQFNPTLAVRKATSKARSETLKPPPSTLSTI
jgi:hypothetical protein